MKLFRTAIIALAIVAGFGAVSAFAKDPQFRILSGKWICPTCDAKHLKGNQTECEAQGHTHVLKLNDGTMVNFVPSNRATDLIHGGGRHSCQIKIAGFYDSKNLTLDVECYAIDGKWTTWCEQENRMDLCRAGGEAKPASEGAQTSAR